jgi:hypothetical protein
MSLLQPIINWPKKTVSAIPSAVLICVSSVAKVNEIVVISIVGPKWAALASALVLLNMFKG